MREAAGPACGNCSGALAAAFAFATVLALAAHIAGAATTLAFAAVLAFAVVLVHTGVRGGRPGAVARATSDAEGGACDQPRHGGGEDQRSCGSIHVHNITFVRYILFFSWRTGPSLDDPLCRVCRGIGDYLTCNFGRDQSLSKGA